MIESDKIPLPKKYFDMEKISVIGFYFFCKRNIPLMLASSITLVSTFGIKLFWHSIGIDTEFFIESRINMWNWAIRTGRFGFPLLSKLWHSNEFNPFFTFFVATCLIWLFTISWCYIIDIFSRNTGRNNNLIPFALVFMTMPVWAEQFYFLQQVVETTLMIGLCPYIIYLFYKGFLDSEKGKIICAIILLTFMISVYQVMIPIFCCGVFAFFVLFQEHSNYESKLYRNLCFKLFFALLGALGLYFFIDRLIIPFVFHIKKADYLDNMNFWGQRSIKGIIFHTLLFGYNITIGHIPFVQKILGSFILRYVHDPVNIWAIQSIPNISRIWGNALLLPVAAGFLFKIVFVLRKTIPPARRLLYVVAGIGIPLSIFFLTILGGGSTPPLRSLFTLPLAFAFMFFYLIKSSKKKAAVIFTAIALLAAACQSKTTSQLFYSDQMRYNDDVRLSFELEKLIKQVQINEQKLPVVFIGRSQAFSRIGANFLQGEVIGHSFFEWGAGHSEVTSRSLSFMNYLGIHFNRPNGNQLEQALKEELLMPSYPSYGCVKRMDDFIIVKLSENQWPFRRIAFDAISFTEIPILKDIDVLQQNVYDIISVDIIDGNIVLHCGNIDPQLYIPLQPALEKPSGETFIEITYTNTEAGYLIVHFDYGEGLAGLSNNTGHHHIGVDIDDATVLLPVVGWDEGKQLVSIRVDPPDNAEFTIKSVKLKSREESNSY